MNKLSELQVEEILVIATAMEMEAAPFLRDLEDAKTVSLAGQTWHTGAWNGRKTCVITTGWADECRVRAARAHLVFGDHLRTYICADSWQAG